MALGYTKSDIATEFYEKENYSYDEKEKMED